MVNGTRQKGYIVTQPVNEPKSGLTVVIPTKDGKWRVAKVLRPSVRYSMGMWMIEVNETNSVQYERSQEELFTLEFQYYNPRWLELSTKLTINSKASYTSDEIAEDKRLQIEFSKEPRMLKAKLKYGQWQAAIDNDEVNENKEVTAEITVGRFFNMAQIIPSEKRIFTRAEAFEIFKHGVMTGASLKLDLEDGKTSVLPELFSKLPQVKS